MKELILVPAESSATSLVFHAADNTEEQFFLEVTDSLRAALLHQEDPDQPENPENIVEEACAPSPNDDADVQVEVEDSSVEDDAPDDKTPSRPRGSLTTREPRPSREVDPRLSTPLSMRPREIQERIRSGATIAEIAEENGVTESRIEPYAHPVLLERARIAELSKKSHPVRNDGPADLTLWEVLATAFAARGEDLTRSHWDAYRDPSGQWVVSVKWGPELGETVAEWSYHRHGTSAATAVARNAVAADLIDPEFSQPVRSLSAVATGRPHLVSAESEAEQTRDDLMAIDDSASAPTDAQDPTTEVSGDDFTQHSQDEHKQGGKRRRKAITPHWEDVLLGVRTNTKRPRK
ncbi:DUF3071 domain-containing protein [Corynebacterium belfantii]|uniref:septation protein SepH n=1 Tax=Corynebacterium belfantii TaxID=2014537 RepID=UPI0018D2A20C|nr:septation protein SepH [Corynebacterium belfantii]MBG9329163.1 DUF3071 domain-containing protein [Corynebacterium belfantii]